MSETVTLTAVFTPDENGWTMAQLAKWPAVVTCGRKVEEALEMLLAVATGQVSGYRRATKTYSRLSSSSGSPANPP